MIENDHVIIANSKEIADMELYEAYPEYRHNIPNNKHEAPPGFFKGEFSEPFLLVSVAGYYKGKVVIHKELI